MGLPGALPLEHSKNARDNPNGSRLSAEEEKLLRSLQKLDGEILKRVAAGLLDTPEGGRPTAGGRPGARPAPSVRQAAGGRPGGAAAGSAPLTNSMQQDNLRESIEKLDGQLSALQNRMKGERLRVRPRTKEERERPPCCPPQSVPFKWALMTSRMS